MIALPWRWLAGAGALLALLAATWWHGHRAGAAEVQQRWDAETAARAEQLREDAITARKASATHQAELAIIRRRAAGLQKELRDALDTPIPSCPATVGAVVVPGAVLDGLRRAGADPAP